MSPPVTECPSCGRPVQRLPTGRPRVYCDDDCKALSYWLTDAEERLSMLAARCTPLAWARVRRLLWGGLNARAWNRGVARVQGKGHRAPWSKKGAA